MESIEHRIFTIRGRKVLIDADLAAIYGVATRTLNQAVKRNALRFPTDFVFQVSAGEKQKVITNCDHLARLKFSKSLPWAYTEHGAIMAAMVLIPDYHQVVQRVFERHISAHHYNADQIRFLRAVQEVFLQKRMLAEADLYEPPLTIFGLNAVDRYFSPVEIRELLNLTASLAA